ncbi:30S ribosomal protein S20 [Candidatus Contubernalis alkaliaceticus]|uniref:30S ribosomal protein S20 n=1 Tax=Candidatus Contubernalis alkaliaceticus TaxID=338645 RepID=UPI001F4C3B7B|nr:30S ribosomal protein S20 [Candidatus Contubernalis alkalaceticus]UNC93247.1 30S ribosomal protein S20 [Candidatus Contubernalis alkalaceticus]
MPNTRSAAKRVKTNLIRAKRNKSVKTVLKSSIRRFQEAINSDNVEEAKTALVKACKVIDKAVVHGVIHKNNASRKKSRLARMLNKKIAV